MSEKAKKSVSKSDEGKPGATLYDRGMTPETGSTQQRLDTMHKRMFWRNILLHWTRNNPRNTGKYYFGFIEIIGLDIWKVLDPHYKNAWTAAFGSFDKMYGLIAAWKPIDWQTKRKEEKTPEKQSAVSVLNDALLKELCSVTEKLQYDIDARKTDADEVSSGDANNSRNDLQSRIYAALQGSLHTVSDADAQKALDGITKICHDTLVRKYSDQLAQELIKADYKPE